MNSRDKGKRGEREVAELLRELDPEAHRGQQYCGIEGKDVIASLPYPTHVEVKRRQQFNIESAMQQAERDASPGEMPVVFHRANNEGWKVTLRAACFIALQKELGRLYGLCAGKDASRGSGHPSSERCDE